ncbi:hypothetical protein GXW78_25425, partial [Roseomonas terrae]|nr:hypothetical protein [Neoroseomonas terrae]
MTDPLPDRLPCSMRAGLRLDVRCTGGRSAVCRRAGWAARGVETARVAA